MNISIARLNKTSFTKFVSTWMIGAGLMVGSLMAGTTNLVTVTLPHAVTVGATTLPAGHYSISSIDMAGSDDLFVIRSEKGDAVATMQGQRVVLSTQSDRTQVVLTKEGNTWSLDKLTIEGDGVSYQFAK